MAVFDGIQNRIDPGDPLDNTIYVLPNLYPNATDIRSIIKKSLIRSTQPKMLTVSL
jgi:glutamine synthetase